MESTRELLQNRTVLWRRGFLLCDLCMCFFLKDCRQRTARSFNTLGGGFGSAGPVMRSDEGEYFHTE